ncbi:MAG: hypothetical protein PHQ23_10395 [Candidatus Wallbacteria bacterium]|nr:hypothetical protein [Candidatus Wallbacteria bacterium]
MMRYLKAIIVLLYLPVAALAGMSKNQAGRPSEQMAEEHFGKALQAYEQHNLDEAFTSYIAAVNCSKLILGKNERGMIQACIDHFRKELLKNPLDARTRYCLARALEFKGEMEAAVKEYRKIIDHFRDSSFASLSWEQINRQRFISTLNE